MLEDEKSRLAAREGSGEGLRLCTPNSTRADSLPGLVVCLGRAHKPRFIIVPLTLMTPRPSPLGIVSENPSPQMRMAGAHPWRLKSTGASRMASGQSTHLRARRGLINHQRLPDWTTRKRCRGSSILSSRSLPAMHAVSLQNTSFRLARASQTGCGVVYVIDSRMASLDTSEH